MDDVWLRVVVVAGALVIAGAVSLLLRRNGRRPVRYLDGVELSPGVYFFSASTCDTCDAAREALSRIVVPGTFTEFAWEERPALFESMRVDVVPATLVVTNDGSAALYAGVPKGLPGAGGP
ncbi:MAG TPA: hypothetical protein VFS66_00795 [Acidimicrobiia bacterium]|nr:hypothetical protein [Acidimicrobiia bacterium]